VIIYRTFPNGWHAFALDGVTLVPPSARHYWSKTLDLSKGGVAAGAERGPAAWLTRPQAGAGNRILWRRVYLAGMCGALGLALFLIARPAPAQEAPLTECHRSAVASRTRVDVLQLLAFHARDRSPVICGTSSTRQ
jgi:hypothetical protein